MNYKKFLLLFFIFLLVYGLPTSLKAENQKEILARQIEILKHEISVLQSLILNWQKAGAILSPSYLAVNLSDESVVLEKNSSQVYPIASITKLMNAVVAAENIQSDKKIILTEQMLSPAGNSPVLFEGLEISTDDLLRASLIQSTNDSAESIAHILGKENFLELMNQKAAELGMANTIFYDAHGLSPKNKSSAQDIAKLLNYIYQNHPQILSITKENDFWLPDEQGQQLKFFNVNNFYPLPNFIGGKTGYSLAAKQTFAGIFNVGSKPIAIIVLQSGNRQADAFSIIKQTQ